MSQKNTYILLEWGKRHLTAALLVILAAGVFFAWWIVDQADYHARTALLQQARLVAHTINIEHLQALSGTEADLASNDYQRLKQLLVYTRSANPQCRFIYLLGYRADGTVFVFMDSEPAGSESYSPPGQVYQEGAAGYRRVLKTGGAIVEGPVFDRRGTWISALVPVTNPKNGALSAVLLMEVNANAWKWEVASKAALPLGLMLVLLVVVSAVLAAVRRANASPKPVIRRLLPSMAAIVILLMVGGGILLWHQHQQNLAETAAADIADVAGDMQMALERPFGLVMAAQSIAADASVQKDLREGAADRLLATWRPVCETMRRQNNLTHFYFFDKNRVCLLRVHNPGLGGEQVDRFTLRGAERTGKTAAGIELGMSGTLTFRVVQPVFENGKIVGYVELGKEIDEVLQLLHTRFGVQLAVVIHKKYLNRKNWEDGMRRLGRNADWDRLPDNVVTYTSQGILPDFFVPWISRSAAERANGETNGEIIRDGKTWQIFAMPLPDASGKEVGNLLIMRDVTTEKAAFARLLILGGTAGAVLLTLLLSFIYVLFLRTDRSIRAQHAELLASRRQLRDVIEFLPDATLAIDNEKRVITWNRAIEKMTGVPAAEMIGKGDYAYTVPFYGETRPQLMDLVFADDEKIAARYSNVTREGDTIMAEIFCNALYNNKGAWVFVKASPLHDQHGNIIGAIESIHDITNRKQTDERLRGSEEMMRYIIKHDPSSIAVFDRNLHYVAVSDRYLHDYNVKDIIGKHHYEVFPEIPQKWRDVHTRCLAGAVERNDDDSFERPDGSTTYNRWECRPWRLVDGEIGGIIVYTEVTTERKQAENELRKTQAILKAALDNSPAGIAIGDAPDGALRYVNDAGLFIRGSDRQSVVSGVGIEQYVASWQLLDFDGKPLQSDDVPLTRAIKLGEICSREFIVRRAPGDDRIVITNAAPIKDENGKVVAGIAIFVDITERKLAEDALRASQQIIEGIINAIPIRVFWKDRNLVYLGCNTMFAQDAGFADPKDIIGKDDCQMIWSEQAELYRADDRQVIESGKPKLMIEEPQTTTEGKIITLLTSKMPLRNSKGEISGVLGTYIDITERKQADEKLRRSEAQLRSYFELPLAGHAITSPSKGWLDVNATLCNMLGYTKAELTQMTWAELTHPDDMPNDLAQFNRIVTGEIDGYTLDKRFIHKDGHSVFTLMAVQCLRHPDRSVDYLVALIMDISDLKRTEVELVKAKEKAEESDRLKSAFLTNMSHEIRTPMNGILGFTELLKEPRLSGEEQQAYISIIEQSGDRMLNTINDIINISKIESGQMEVFMSETNVNEQIEYIYTFFKPEVEQKNIRFSFKTALPAKAAVINTDQEKVYGILTNLVKNAIKFTHAGSIEFGYEKKGEFIEFFVKDTGIGIPKDRQEAVFERFIQVDVHNARAFQGSGLGLSISKAYAEMLGGRIWMESELGKGTTFYFTIPYNAEFERKKTVENVLPAGEEETLAKNLKILIAEDDEKSEMLATITVKSLSKEILKARTGVEAVEICRNNPDLDLILMDIEMPQMNGYDASKQIRQFNKDVIIIAQTAYALAGEREKAIAAGCNDYIAKPFKKSSLLALLKKYF